MRSLVLLSMMSLLVTPSTSCSADDSSPAKKEAAIKKLWNDALQYQTKKNWEKLETTLKQIIELDPGFPKVREFAAWNWAYNISAEYDDVGKKYTMIKKGVGFLLDGLQKDPNNPIFLWWGGIIIGDKIGMHDKRVELQKLFESDRKFHQRLKEYVDIGKAKGVDGHPNNYLVASLFFRKANAAIDNGRKQVRMHPAAFEIRPARSLAAYAAILSVQGRFKSAANAWKLAQDEFRRFGERKFNGKDKKIRLGHPTDDPKSVKILRTIVQYDSWVKRCEVEQTAPFVSARKALWTLLQDTRKKRPTKSAQEFDATISQWQALYRKHSFMEDDEETGRILLKVADFYDKKFNAGRRSNRGSPFPKLRRELRMP